MQKVDPHRGESLLDRNVHSSRYEETIHDRTGQPVETSRSDYLQKDYGLSWSSQEWKSGAAAHDRSGKLEKTSWDMMQKVAPHREELFSAEVRIPQGTEGGFMMDPEQPDSANSHEESNSENLVMCSDATEFVDKVKDQVRNRQKRMSNVAESGEEHFNNMGNVHGCDVKCGDIHGKEFLNYSKFQEL